MFGKMDGERLIARMPWSTTITRTSLEVHSLNAISVKHYADNMVKLGHTLDDMDPFLSQASQSQPVYRVDFDEESGNLSVLVRKGLLPPIRTVMPCEEYRALMECSDIKLGTFNLTYVVNKHGRALGWRCTYMFEGSFPNVCKPSLAFGCSEHVRALNLDENSLQKRAVDIAKQADYNVERIPELWLEADSKENQE